MDGLHERKGEMPMGLDMYAFVTAEKPLATVDFETFHSERLHYWRKHPNLLGWMEALYREKRGSAEKFNCVYVLLSAEDLDRLEGRYPEAMPAFDGRLFLRQIRRLRAGGRSGFCRESPQGDRSRPDRLLHIVVVRRRREGLPHRAAIPPSSPCLLYPRACLRRDNVLSLFLCVILGSRHKTGRIAR
jgi:hypothetical protein